MTLTGLLDQWRGHLTRLGAPVAPLLLPGVERTTIEAALGPAVPEAVLEWFGWCGGVGYAPGQSIGDSYTIPGYWNVGLREAIEVKPDHEDAGAPLLAGHWVPLLQDGSTGLYAACWLPGTEPTVASSWPEIGPATVEFDSIAQMVTVFNACFARSAYFLDEEGWLDVEDDRYAEIYQEIVGRPYDDE